MTLPRLLSHELRTPLNSAFLELKVVLDELRDSLEEDDDHEMLETLTDVHKSCLTAVDILNDLMCFDKVRVWVTERPRGRCVWVTERPRGRC